VNAARLPGGADRAAPRLPELGPLSLRAANARAALSAETALAAPRWCGEHRLLPGDGAQLRLDPGELGRVFTLTEGGAGRRREGLRFLNGAGEVALAAELTAASDRGAYRRLAEGLPASPADDAGGGVADTGEAGEGVPVGAVDPGLVPELLETLADAAIPVRLVLPVRGLWLTATTLIGNPVRRQGRLDLHGVGVHLALAPGGLTAGVRRLAVADGQAHALDLLDGAGRPVLRLMGQAVPGRPEDGAWRTLVEALGPRE
jgi:putative heme degradation protein